MRQPGAGLTLRTHDLPDFFGGVSPTIKAASDGAFRRLIAGFVGSYVKSLINPHWGEQVAFLPRNEPGIGMLFQGLDQGQAERARIGRPAGRKLAMTLGGRVPGVLRGNPASGPGPAPAA